METFDLEIRQIACMIDVIPTVDGIVIGSPVPVNMYRPAGQRTIKEYFEERLEPFLQEKLFHVNLLDVIWHIYLESSLKMTAHQKCGVAKGNN